MSPDWTLVGGAVLVTALAPVVRWWWRSGIVTEETHWIPMRCLLPTYLGLAGTAVFIAVASFLAPGSTTRRVVEALAVLWVLGGIALVTSTWVWRRPAWLVLPAFRRLPAHDLAVYDVRPTPTDASFEPYYIATCACGWVGVPHQSPEEASRDAQTHVPDVEPPLRVPGHRKRR